MIIDALVPAHNEAPRVAAVVAPLLASGAFRRVTVIDDGSTDGTTEAAVAAGAHVLRLLPNRGKGAAMKAGVDRSDADAVAFFDADLVGLTAAHARALVAPVTAGRAAMAVGLRDQGPFWSLLQGAMPVITGERVVTRAVLERMPADFWRGFRVEMGLNAAATDLGVEVVQLHGLQIVPKWAKIGVRAGIRDAAQMMAEVLVAARDAQALRPR